MRAVRKRSAPKPSKRTRGVATIAALVSAILVVWLANQTPPRVTHAEAMAMALAIDQSNQLVKLEQLVHVAGLPQVPPDFAPQADDAAKWLAGCIHFWKGKSSYAFVETRTDDKGGKSLMFRCANEDTLLDYHELRLERCDGTVKVTDHWSLTGGGWLRELLTERAQLLDSPQTSACTTELLQAIAAKDDRRATAAFLAMPPQLRASRFIALQYFLSRNNPKNVDAYRIALTEFRSSQPENLAPDLAILMFPIMLAASQAEVMAALARIHARVGDDTFLEQVRARLVR